VLERIDDTITYALIPNSHILVYPIPGVDGRVDRGHRRWNFVWYRNVDKGATFDELMTDRDGFPHSVSLRPGRVQDRYVRELKELAIVAARDRLYSHSHRTSVHPGDYGRGIAHYGHRSGLPLGGRRICGPTARGGRNCQGSENAWTLAEAIEAFAGDLPSTLQMWSEHQTALGSSLIARTRHIGEGSQFRCDWRPGDPGLRFGLYEPGDSSIWTRAPRAVVPRTPNCVIRRDGRD